MLLNKLVIVLCHYNVSLYNSHFKSVKYGFKLYA